MESASTDRDKSGRFLPGHGIKSPGRPPGVPKVADAIRKQLESNPERAAELFWEAMEDRDSTIWKLAMERIWPAPPRGIELSGPDGGPVEHAKVLPIPEEHREEYAALMEKIARAKR